MTEYTSSSEPIHGSKPLANHFTQDADELSRYHLLVAHQRVPRLFHYFRLLVAFFYEPMASVSRIASIAFQEPAKGGERALRRLRYRLLYRLLGC